MKTNIDRRDFLKTAGYMTVAGAGMNILSGCRSKSASDSEAITEDSGAEMTVRTDPKTGDKIGILGYGCMRWPMIKNEEDKDIVDQETVNHLVDHAIKNGVNYFDTAPLYLQGQSEKATGIALKRHPRESYYIATKLSNMRDHTYESAIAMYRRSMENLQTDYIDYYLLHSLSGGEAFKKRYLDNGVIDFVLKEREAGRIRNLGFSFHGNSTGFDELLELHEKYHWDFVQIQLNWMDWTHAGKRNTNAEYLQAELDKKGIPSIIMEPLLGGRLAKVPEHIAERLKERNPSGSIASWAFRFAGSHDGVLCVLSGMTYMEHLQDNIKTYSPLVRLNEEEMNFLEETAELMSRYPLIPCNDCQYCMPCPYGIDIPGILLHYNKCVTEGEMATDSGSSDYRRLRRAYLVSYDRAVPELRQADRCINCGECSTHCPQNINIPVELFKIDRYIEKLRQDNL